jgi:hypothetical protein
MKRKCSQLHGTLRSHTFTYTLLYNTDNMKMQTQEGFVFVRLHICENIRSEIVLRAAYGLED